MRVTAGGGLEKLSQGRNFFFLVSAPAQLSAYANHEFKIIPTPTQLSAYANHELKNWCYLAKVARRQTARAKYRSRTYAQLERNIEKTAQSQVMHISWIARRAKILLHMLSICTKHAKSWTQLVTCSLTSYRSCYSCQIFLVRFFLHSHCSAHDLHHHFSRRFQHLHWMNLERAEFLFSICATYANCDSHLQII